MGLNRRYETRIDDAHHAAIDAHAADLPLTLPQQAYGPEPIAWVPRSENRPEVWAWVHWANRPATRIPAAAHGWNDRVVVITWHAVGGERQCVVWRNAVTKRT